LSNDPQEQTASANSAGEVAGVAVNRQAGNAAAVLASMIQQPPPPPSFTMPISANEVSLAQARALMKVAKINEKARKKREREEDAGMFTDVDDLKKKKVAKEEAQRLKMEKKKVAEMAKFAEDTAYNLDDFGIMKRTKAKSTQLDNWRLGNKAARERKDEYIKAATVESLPEVRVRLKNHGWAIMNNMTSLFDNNYCRPTKEQSNYILNTNDDNKNVIFEGAVLHDNSSVINLETKKDKLRGRARFQLKSAGHSGTWAKKYLDLCKKHRPQLSTIIEGMFEDEVAR
jgi:hypothetical protein